MTFALKGTSSFLKNDVCLVQFFRMEGHTAYMQYHAIVSLPKHIIYIHFTIMLLFAMFFNQLVHSLTKEALRILAPTRSSRKTIII